MTTYLQKAENECEHEWKERQPVHDCAKCKYQATREQETAIRSSQPLVPVEELGEFEEKVDGVSFPLGEVLVGFDNIVIRKLNEVIRRLNILANK